MALRPIVRLGDPVLERASLPVGAIDASLKALVGDMVQTMYAAPGVGLAAVQIGVPLRVAVIDVSVGRDPEQLMVLVNPEIVRSEGRFKADEGCLSVPGYMEPVERAAVVEFKARDLEGRELTRLGEGLLARAVQHEIDHMEGRLFLSHLSRIKRKLIQRQIDKRTKAGTWP
jgi:peptide deformylase